MRVGINAQYMERRKEGDNRECVSANVRGTAPRYQLGGFPCEGPGTKMRAR